MSKAKSFRFVYDTDAKLLGIPVTIEYVDIDGFIQRRELTAAIDTGATQCFINRKIAKEMRFTKVGITKTHTAGGVIQSGIHTVNIILPENIRFDDEEILEMTDMGIDFVIGLNILKKGDFMLSHLNDELIFSFRIPPVNDGNAYRTDTEMKVSLGRKI